MVAGFFSGTHRCDGCIHVNSCSTTAACNMGYGYSEVVVTAAHSTSVMGAQRLYRCAGSRQKNNLAMRIHWSHDKQHKIIRDSRKYVAIIRPRRLQRGRGR